MRLLPRSFYGRIGAGDAFGAGFIFALLNREPLAETVKHASAMGASCVRKVGCLTGLFSQEELRRFVQDNVLPMDIST